jgi:hypothetical protein
MRQSPSATPFTGTDRSSMSSWRYSRPLIGTNCCVEKGKRYAIRSQWNWRRALRLDCMASLPPSR